MFKFVCCLAIQNSTPQCHFTEFLNENSYEKDTNYFCVRIFRPQRRKIAHCAIFFADANFESAALLRRRIHGKLPYENRLLHFSAPCANGVRRTHAAVWKTTLMRYKLRPQKKRTLKPEKHQSVLTQLTQRRKKGKRIQTYPMI